MVQTRERSTLFKFFYALLCIITFPIFAVLFVLRHPALTVLFLLILAGGAAYYPISQGVEADKVIDWYANKISFVKKKVVVLANAKGYGHLVPKTVVEEVKNEQEEAKDADLPKGENYNTKVVRDDKAENTKAMLKKRDGFKKKGEESTELDAKSAEESTSEAEMENPVDEETDEAVENIINRNDATFEEKKIDDAEKAVEEVKEEPSIKEAVEDKEVAPETEEVVEDVKEEVMEEEPSIKEVVEDKEVAPETESFVMKDDVSQETNEESSKTEEVTDEN